MTEEEAEYVVKDSGEEVASEQSMPGQPDWKWLIFELLRAALEVVLKWLQPGPRPPGGVGRVAVNVVMEVKEEGADESKQ